MPATPDQAAPVLAALGRLGRRSAGAEEGLLAALAGLGEPLGQRVLDDWLDVAADLLQAVTDEAEAEAALLAAAVRGDRRAPGGRARPGSASCGEGPAGAGPAARSTR